MLSICIAVLFQKPNKRHANFNVKKLFLVLILSFFSAQSFAGSCPDGSDPVKSISADGTYFVYNCGGSSNNTSASTNSSSSASKSSSNESSKGIDTFGGGWPPEDANPNYDTLRYFLYRYLYHLPNIEERYHEVKGSNNPFNFQFDLREDAYIKQHMQTTPLLSYLVYEDGKIVIDEITPKDRFGDMFSDTSMYTSASVGKSIASYITGHAICEGKIKSVDSRLDDWPVLEDTLYHNQKLIDLLNMSAGDQAYVKNNSFLNTNRDSTNVNRASVQSMMKNEFKGSKKSYAQYNYVDSIPNIVMSYLIFKYGDDNFKQLLDDVLKEKSRIENGLYINKNEK